LPKVYADPSKITQVLSNLIGNSIKFTKKGSITINAPLAGDNIQVDIIDSGIGIKNRICLSFLLNFFKPRK